MTGRVTKWNPPLVIVLIPQGSENPIGWKTVNQLYLFFQAPSYYIKHYEPIQHEDGLETAILGLDFAVTPRSFEVNQLSISLRCSSSVSTVNSEAQTTETHHQKSSTHFSYGSLFAGGQCSSINAYNTNYY